MEAIAGEHTYTHTHDHSDLSLLVALLFGRLSSGEL